MMALSFVLSDSWGSTILTGVGGRNSLSPTDNATSFVLSIEGSNDVTGCAFTGSSLGESSSPCIEAVSPTLPCGCCSDGTDITGVSPMVLPSLTINASGCPFWSDDSMMGSSS